MWKANAPHFVAGLAWMLGAAVASLPAGFLWRTGAILAERLNQ